MPEQPALPAPRRSPDGRHRRRQKLMQAIEFCQSISLDNPKVRYRYRDGMQMGTLPVPIERAVLEIAYGRPQSIDKRLLDAMGAEAGRSLINLLLRKPLTTDPLAEAKPVGGQVVIDQPPQSALEPRPSIVPPARPKQMKGTGPPLKPGEEELR